VLLNGTESIPGPNEPNSKSVGTFFGKANFIEKEGMSYCVRPEECVVKNDGEIKGSIGSVLYLGEKQEVELYFNFEKKEYIFKVYVDKNMNLTHKENLNFDIIWENCTYME